LHSGRPGKTHIIPHLVAAIDVICCPTGA
jgi:hypothetical protein